MKVCIYGAGAIGGYLAVQLELNKSAEVTCIARGPHLEAMRSQGLKIHIGDKELTAKVNCTDNPA